MNKEQKFIPSGDPTDVFDKKRGRLKSYSTFQTDLYNLALDKDVSKKRNLIYLILIIICVIATVFVTTTASYKTYVVRVNEATGEIQTGGELKVTNYTPQEAEIRHFLAEFILDTRTIPLDPIQYKNGLEKSKHFMTSEASQKFNALLMKDDPVKKLGRYTARNSFGTVATRK